MNYIDPGHTIIRVTADGGIRYVPVDSSNADYAALIASGLAIAPYLPPLPSDQDLRAEAYRRLRTIHGAVDDTHMANIAADDARERLVLSGVIETQRTSKQRQRLTELMAKDAQIEAVLASYNAMPVPAPADYTTDARWPG
jgi:transcriptional regulator of met regulon